jgi:hypothetical protein
MKKFFILSAGVLLVVVVAIGAAQATPYDFSLLGVDKATRVWIYDAKDDDGLTSVTSDWKKNVLFEGLRPNRAFIQNFQTKAER